jgi:hypothetical protein
MKKFLLVSLFSLNILYSQDLYSLFGYRFTTMGNDNLTSTLSPYVQDWSDQYLLDAKVGNENEITGWTLGLGYRWFDVFNNPNLYINSIYKVDQEHININLVDDYDGGWKSIYHNTNVLGLGMGYMTEQGISVEFGVDYNIGSEPSGNYWYYMDDFGGSNYVSFNIKVGYTIGSRSGNAWTSPFGVHYSVPSNKKFMNSDIFGQHNPSTQEILVEFPGTWTILAGAVILIAAAAQADDGGSVATHEWDQFYNQYGILIWRCRSTASGQFATDSTCAGKRKSDSTWPNK